MATTPLQQWQQRHCDDSKDACTLMMTMTPLQQGQQCQLEDGNNTITMRATTALQIKGNNTIDTRPTKPSWQRQGRLRINSRDNAIVMRATIAIATTAKILRINGNNAIATWVTMPAQQQAMRATALAQQWWRHACTSTTVTMQLWREQQSSSQQQQRCLHIDGNNASLPVIDKGNNIDDDDNAISTRAMTPAWGWQQRHHNKGTMPSWIKGNNTIVTMATMPAWWWQGRLRINNGNNTIVMRVTIAMATMAKMPAHWRQQCHHNEGNNASLTICIKGDDASLTDGRDACALTTTTAGSWQEQQSPSRQRHHNKGDNTSLTTSN
jgi:hypothetical protein